MRAAVYARYSSTEQTGGESIEYQLEQCREYIARKGWYLDDQQVYVDKARSGTTVYRRDSFNRMVSNAKLDPAPFDVVVVYSTSRFGRDMDQCAVNKAFLRKQGVEVHFVSQPLPGGHVGKLIEKIFEWTDELQSIQIGEYAFQGQKQVTQRGYHGGGKAPFGYKRIRVKDPQGKTDKNGRVVEYTTYEVVPDEARIVERIYRLYAAGSSYRKIAHTLNSEGTASPRGSSWDQSGVRTIILNENYRGNRVWNQTRRNKKVRRGTKVPKPRSEWIISENAHDAIIDDDLWKAVQERRGRIQIHIKEGGNSRTAHSPYLLSGLLKCDTCGANFTMSSRRKNGKREGRYRCSYRANRGPSVCTNSRTISQDKIEACVLEVVAADLLRWEVIEAILEDARAGAATERVPDLSKTAIENRLRKLDSEVRNLTSAIKAGGPIEDLVAELKNTKQQRAIAERERQSLVGGKGADLVDYDEDDVREAVRDLRGTLEYASPQEKKALLIENIRMIRVPRKGAALLEVNPAGLLGTLGVHLNGDPEGSRTPVS